MVMLQLAINREQKLLHNNYQMLIKFCLENAKPVASINNSPRQLRRLATQSSNGVRSYLGGTRNVALRS